MHGNVFFPSIWILRNHDLILIQLVCKRVRSIYVCLVSIFCFNYNTDQFPHSAGYIQEMSV